MIRSAKSARGLKSGGSLIPLRPRILFKDAIHSAQKTHAFSFIKPANQCWIRK
jgi:hypothetical protein